MLFIKNNNNYEGLLKRIVSYLSKLSFEIFVLAVISSLSLSLLIITSEYKKLEKSYEDLVLLLKENPKLTMDNFFSIQKLSTNEIIVKDVYSEDIKKHCKILKLNTKKVEKLISLERISFIDKGYKVFLSNRTEKNYCNYFRLLFFEWDLERKTSFKRFLADKYLEYFYAKKIDNLILYLDKKSITINRKKLESWKNLN